MRVLGVDWGEKRIGIAVGDSEHGIASPRANVAASGGLKRDAAAIAAAAANEGADAIVVGVPENPLGSDRMARVCLQLAERLRELGLLVYTMDESMTSAEAASKLTEAGLRSAARGRYVDGEAAAQLLGRFFAGSSAAGPHARGIKEPGA